MNRYIRFILTVGVSLVAGSAQAQLFDPFRPAPGSFRGAPTIFDWSGPAGEPGGPPGFDEPLASDRPDFTESSTTVGRGVVQIEMGYTFIRDNDGGTYYNTHSFPESLFRVGMFADWFEFRFAYNHGIQLVAPPAISANTVAGGEDLYTGVKLALTSQRRWLPEMAIVPQFTIPSGDTDFSAHDVLPGVNWLYGWDITERLSTGGSTQVNKSVDDDGTNYYEFAQSWTVGFGWTNRLGSYIELFSHHPSGASSAKPEYYLDGGLTFRVTNNLQLDARAGTGINGAAADYFLGSGAVVRF